MSFLLLYRQRNNASAKLQKFLLIAENCRRSVAGEPLLIDKCERLYSVARFIDFSRFSLNLRNLQCFFQILSPQSVDLVPEAAEGPSS
uniref:Uncharacterized protein n=1 Tax=Ascaris lumbricoides TaxID=6252 RepID=A0A0M3HKR2_ASCLU